MSSTTRAYLVASNTGEEVTTPSLPSGVPVFPPEHLVQAQAFHSPIHTAIYNPNLDLSTIESMIQSNPACVHIVHPQSGYTPLHAAVRRTHIGMIRTIVEHGADLEAKANEGETPLLVACQVGSLYVVDAVIELGADVKAVDNLGRNAMHTAANMGAPHIMHYLATTQGMDFRSRDNEGNTPLHYAVHNRSMDTIKYLLRKKRCDVGAANNEGITPLHIAAKYGNRPLCYVLLTSTRKKRKLLSAKDSNGATPLDLVLNKPSANYKILAQMMVSWKESPRNAAVAPYLIWGLYALVPAITMFIAIVVTCHVFQPIGFILAIIIAFLGFFVPMTRHRIPHEAGWQNPVMLGGLIMGVCNTVICYFIAIWPHVWPDNMIGTLIIVLNSCIGLYLFIKLKRTNPGFDEVGKVGADGIPLTILDVARQGSRVGGSSAHTADYTSDDGLAFCINCEIVIPDHTKHCKLCNGCCNGFDHHCMWLTSCVGYNNHRVFILFTIALGLDNFVFVWQACSYLSKVADSYNPWIFLGVGFSTENWIILLLFFNFATGIFVFMNSFDQLKNISKLETTYFDMRGQPAYRKKREAPRFTLVQRCRQIHLFFTDYPRWFSRRMSSPINTRPKACYPQAFEV